MYKYALFSLLVPTFLFCKNNSLIQSCDNEDCCNFYDCIEKGSSGYLATEHREAGGIGYSNGFTSLDFFYSPNIKKRWFSFTDLQGHLFKNGKWAANSGVGLRYLPEWQNIIYGINTYWDYRKTKHTQFQQIGAGIEFLGPRWDVHINGYAPYNRQKHSYQTGFVKFQNNHALIYKKYEVAMSGLDLAAGYWIYDSDCFGIYSSLGGYYLKGNLHQETCGGLLQTKVRVTDWINISGQVSYDPLFNWNVQGAIFVRLPFGKKLKISTTESRSCKQALDLSRKLATPPERFEIIPTSTHKKTAIALDPITEEPLIFLFVNPPSDNNETFEGPNFLFEKTQQTSSRSYAVHIYPGSGADRNMNIGIVKPGSQVSSESEDEFTVESQFGPISIQKIIP